MGKNRELLRLVGSGSVVNPGGLPTVLVGSLFHEGHRIVKDRKLGIFDKQRARRLVETQQEMSERTGVPCMLDIVAEKPEPLMKYVDLVSEVTDAPFLINGQDMSVRISAADPAVDLGLRDRAVCNSINYTLNEDEIQAINETGLRAAVIQAFNPRNPRPEGIDRWRRIGEYEENAKKMCKAGAATVA